jgi:Zn-dependent membrane protease YugP
MFFFDPTYLCFMAPAFILMMLTSWYVKSAYNRWSRVRVRSGLTGAQAAQRLIASGGYNSNSWGIQTSSGGLSGVRIQRIGGDLTDNYDPRTKVLNLSQSVADVPSVAAVAVAAHELGHAMQDADDYLPMRFRSALVPMVNIGSWLGWIMIMGGIVLATMMNATSLGTQIAWLGVLVFSGGALFALATLPVELNASARAKRLLAETGIISGQDEIAGVNTVLNAAALTYVAGLASALLQLLYFVSIVSGLGGRRRS